MSKINVQAYYHILKVKRTSSIDDIKRSYKKLAIKLHPDKDRSKHAHENFCKLVEAYTYLLDHHVQQKSSAKRSNNKLKNNNQKNTQKEKKKPQKGKKKKNIDPDKATDEFQRKLQKIITEYVKNIASSPK
jgi:DnaJ-class molecular chaperone